MENKILAIKGHPTRGKEVIEILEMLGGKNKFNFKGNEDKWLVLNGNIQWSNFLFDEKGFTLEEFLEKYPFKVGDKVQYKGLESGSIYSCCSIFVVEKILWENNQIKYIICNTCCDTHKFTTTAEDLQPYKEEICTYYAIDNDSKTDITIDGEKLIAPNGYTIGTATRNGNSLIVEYFKNKPQYPKTYGECSQIIKKVAKTTHELDIAYNPNLIYNFQKLLICRDAYWKIAGDQMKLSNSWEPCFKDDSDKYFICYVKDEVWKSNIRDCNKVLVFPTEEMRNAFYENFKDLIESCKELL